MRELDVTQNLVADNVLAQLRMLGSDHGGFPVDRLEHSLQTATRAERDGHDDEYVLCALLHDIGDNLAPLNHPAIAAGILEPFASQPNHWMVAHHGIFQGYNFWHHIGLNRDHREKFRESPYFGYTEEFCAKYDSPAFDADYRSEPLEHYLPRVAKGDLHVSFGVTEPDAGTDTTNISIRAEKVAGGWRIRGRKIWNSKGDIAEKCLLLARTRPLRQVGKRTEGISLFLVDMQVPEVSIRPIPKLGRNAVASCEVAFDDAFVADADLVGEEGSGFKYLLDGLIPERILLASEAFGIGRAAMRRGVGYARERVVFGREIGRNQGISFPLAELHMRLLAAELMIREASSRYDNGMECGAEANAAKYLAADAGFSTADQVMQTLGGFGYALEYDVERYWREARLLRIAPVSQEMILNYIAERTLGLPRSY
jgi:acyl-CoA dehydrogenase